MKWNSEVFIDIGGGNQMELVMTLVCPLGLIHLLKIANRHGWLLKLIIIEYLLGFHNLR